MPSRTPRGPTAWVLRDCCHGSLASDTRALSIDLDVLRAISNTGPMRVPDISIIVSSFERPLHLERVLESIACQVFSKSLEIVVSDDGSQDRTPDVVEQFAEFRRQQVERIGATP